MGGGGGWDYDYSEAALGKSGKAYEAEARAEGVVREFEAGGGKGLAPPVGKEVRTSSPTPLVVGVDVTGSMGEWPKLIFQKLPVLYNEAKLHLPEVEISFCAIGDANIDSYPLQVCDFGQGQPLEEAINSLYPEAGGGGGIKESYEMAAYFYARHCHLPPGRRGLFVFCGDEAFYERIKAGMARRLFGDDLPQDLDSFEVFAELKKSFDVYILRVPYRMKEKDEEIRAQWQQALDQQTVLTMEDPKRIVDCVIGLAAIYADEQDAFGKRLALRQTPEQVQQVMATLHPVLSKT